MTAEKLWVDCAERRYLVETSEALRTYLDDIAREVAQAEGHAASWPR